MANRTFQPASSLDRQTVALYGAVTIGATGAITAQDCNGFTLTRTDTGAYTIALDDEYPTSPANYVASGTKTSPLLACHCDVLDAGTRLYQKMTMLADTISTDGKLTIIFDASANTPADPNSGAILFFTIVLKNSSSPRKGL